MALSASPEYPTTAPPPAATRHICCETVPTKIRPLRHTYSQGRRQEASHVGRGHAQDKPAKARARWAQTQPTPCKSSLQD